MKKIPHPKAILSLALLTTLLPCGAAPAAAPRPAVARIVVAESGGTAYGSGALVDARGEYGLVVTNWHVVRDATGPIEVVFHDGFRSEARPIKLDKDWDLAALVIWRPTVAPLPLAGRAPRPGDELIICGYGSGEYREATGRCTDYYAPEIGLPHELVELSVEARQGDSGGPILNDRGEIAGVLFGAGQGTTLGSFGGRVGTFLASVAPGISAPLPATPQLQNPPPAMVAVQGPGLNQSIQAPPQAVASQPTRPAAPAWQTDLLAASNAFDPTPDAAPATDKTSWPSNNPWPTAGDRYANNQSPQISRQPSANDLFAEAPESAPAQAAAPTETTPPATGPVVASLPTEAEYAAAPGWLDEAKTIFALVGVVFVVLQLIRLVT